MYRKILRSVIVSVLLFAIYTPVRGQYYLTGDNPARIKWNRIRGEHFTVIYPREIDSLARRYLGLLEMTRPRVLAGLEIDPKPLPVVLNPYTTNSNGLVVWAPKRMELYTLPPANNTYAHNWEEQLVLHESRHVGQISHFTKGIFKPLSWFIGQQSPGLGVGIYPSAWFLEGDAVMTETELSRSGRGRSADFMEYYRAAFLNGEYRSWDRWRYGSYKYYTPDIYALGYLINGTVRYQTGNYLYSGELLNYYVRKFYNPNVTNAAYRKVAGATRRAYLKRGEQLMTSLWEEDFRRRGRFTKPRPVISRSSSYYTEYKYNVPLGPDSLAAVKYAFDRPTALVLLGTGAAFKAEHKNGEKILRAFSSNTGNLQGHGQKIYWTETVQSARWGKEAFNDLFVYDLSTHKVKRLSRRTYYNNPSVHPSGRIITVAEYPVTGGSNLVGLDARTGEKLFSVQAPGNGQLLESAWVKDTLYAVAITSRGEGVFRIPLDKLIHSKLTGNHAGISQNGAGVFPDKTQRQIPPGSEAERPGVSGKDTEVNAATPTGPLSGSNLWETVIKEQHQNMKFLRSGGEYLYFTADFDGVNNIYLYDPRRQVLGRLTNARYGAYYPAVEGDRLYYSDFSQNGLYPVSVQLDSARTLVYERAGVTAEAPAGEKPAPAGYIRDSRDGSAGPGHSGRVINGFAGRESSTEIYLDNGEVKNIYKYPVAEKLTEQAKAFFAENKIPAENGEKMEQARRAESKRYRKGLNLFRFHSWGPIYYNVDNIMSMSSDHFYELAAVGATVYSQNTLGTAVTMLGYSYRNGFNAGHLKFTYSGWLPVLEISADFNQEDRYRYKILKRKDQTYALQVSLLNKSLLETSIRAYVPVNLSSRGWLRGLIPQAEWEFENTEYYSYEASKYQYLNRLKFALQYYQMRPVTKAEIFPRWGFNVTAKAAVAPGGKENFGSTAALYSYFYLPGVAAKQGVRLTFGWQKQFVDGKFYYLGNLLDMPRGYKEVPLENYVQGSVDYAIPVYLGDKSLGCIAYLQRLKLIPFADYAYNRNYTGKYHLYSFGADVLVDTYLFRIGVPLSLGVRYARTEEGRNYVGFLFSTSLFNK